MTGMFRNLKYWLVLSTMALTPLGCADVDSDTSPDVQNNAQNNNQNNNNNNQNNNNNNQNNNNQNNNNNNNQGCGDIPASGHNCMI